MLKLGSAVTGGPQYLITAQANANGSISLNGREPDGGSSTWSANNVFGASSASSVALAINDGGNLLFVGGVVDGHIMGRYYLIGSGSAVPQDDAFLIADFAANDIELVALPSGYFAIKAEYLSTEGDPVVGSIVIDGASPWRVLSDPPRRKQMATWRSSLAGSIALCRAPP